MNRFKNVVFDIGSTEDPGIFSVNCKFMGVNMDQVVLVFQVSLYDYLYILMCFSVF